MLKQHTKLISTSLYLADIAVTTLSFFLAYWIRVHYISEFKLWGILGHVQGIERYSWLIFIIIPVWSVLLFYYKAYRSFRTEPLIKELLLVWKVILIGGVIIGAIAFILKFLPQSRGHITIFILVNMVLIATERLTVRLFSHYARKRGYNYKNVLIVGVDKKAREIVRLIEDHSEWGFRIIGFVTDVLDDMHNKIDNYRVIGNINEMQEIVNREVIDEVIFALPKKRLEQIEDIFLMLEDYGINTRVIVNFFPHVVAKVQLENLENIPLLTFTTTPTNIAALAIKRLFDIVVSMAVLAAALPIIAGIAILIRYTSKGPIFFKQKRCGLNGRVFTLYKFRSMVLDAELRKKELEALNEMKGPVFKVKNDPRVTRIGRFVRKTSIDELPQFWNVLKGDMSIVGPRPPLPDEVAKYERWQKRRLSMKPGITCIWQVSGRNRIKDFNEWVKLDLQYIDNWSLKLDMQIFFKTIPVVLFRKGAA